MPIAKAIKLAVLIICRDVRDQFRVKHFNVVSLVKVIRDDFPVTASLCRHVQHPQHVFYAMRLKLSGDGLT